MKHRRGVLLGACLVIAMVTAAGILGCGQQAQDNTGEATTAKAIPQLAGLTEQDARAALEAGGWTSFQIEYLAVPDDQVGMVLSQQPASGEPAGEEQLMVLVVGAKEQVQPPVEDSGGSGPADTPSDSGSGGGSSDSTPESTWVSCPFCGGTGKVNGTTCGVCLGTGQVR